MLRKLASVFGREYSILRCSQVPLTQNTNTLPIDETECGKLLWKIINYEKKVKKTGDVVVYSKISPVSNPPKSVWTEICKYFKKFKEKDKTSSFGKQLHDEVFLWLTGVLSVSSIILGHKCSYDNKGDKQKCFAKYISKDVLETLLTSKHLNHKLLLGINSSPSKLVNTKPENAVKEQVTEDDENADIDRLINKFQKTANECNGSLLNKVALKYAENKEDARAFHIFLKAASYEHMGSQYNVALCYEHGRGTKRSLSQAARFYKAAADKGHVKAMYNLALLCFDELLGIDDSEELDIKSGYHYMKMAADHGMDNGSFTYNVNLKISIFTPLTKLEAQLFLGLQYSRKFETETSFSYFKMAAEKSNVVALFNLGTCYEHGMGCDVNYSEANRCYQKAAELGHSVSMFRMGDAYQYGLRGVKRNLENALVWFEKAAKNGHRESDSRIKAVGKELIKQKENLKVQYVNAEPFGNIFNPLNNLLSLHKSSSLSNSQLYTDSRFHSGQNETLLEESKLVRQQDDFIVFMK